jgi:hypothetical protein
MILFIISLIVAISWFYFIVSLPPAITSCLPLPINPNILSDSSSNRSIGAVVHFNCISDNFKLIGSSVAVCLADGTWNTTVPTCVDKNEQVQCPELIKPGGHMSSSSSNRSIDTEVVLTCEDGFKLDGEGTLHCMENGKWNTTTPTCTSTATPAPQQQTTNKGQLYPENL